METFKAEKYNYRIIRKNKECENRPYPYLREETGHNSIYCIGPSHGRSFLISTEKINGRFIVSKGNGLSYTQYNFLNTQEMGNDTWGLLLKSDAIRDFDMAKEVGSLGIKINSMEYVLEIDKEVFLKNGTSLKPVLLQYSVECPYRICDFPIIPENILQEEIDKWERMNEKGFNEKYLIAANILIKNLYLMHSNLILHNAIHMHNITWALELLDFEIACSPNIPYSTEDAQRHVNSLYSREIIQTYEIIKNIACFLKEDIDYKKIDCLFEEYGFKISELKTR